MNKVQQTSFYVYYIARQLENLPDNDKLVPIFDSSDLRIYPFQIAASAFVLRSPYLKGQYFVMKLVWEKAMKPCWSLLKDGWRGKTKFCS